MRRNRSKTKNKPPRGATKTSKTDDNTTALEPPKIRSISSRCKDIGGIYHAETADVNFVFDVNGNEELVPVHKYILSAHSPVFRRMFYESELKEGGEIRLNDTTIDAFIYFLEFLYGWKYFGQTDSKSELSPLLYLAHKYDVKSLEERCKQILDFIIDKDIEAVLWVLPLANLYSYDELQRKCIEKIRQYGNLIIQSPKIIDCETAVVGEILGIDFVDRNEVKVFEMSINRAKRACVKAKMDPESSENIRALGDCFHLVRIGSMTSQQFVQCLSINSAVFTSYEIQQLAKNVVGPIRNTETFSGVSFVPLDVSLRQLDLFTPVLQSLYEDQVTADVTFIFKNEKNEETQRISAHKCILAKQSKVFADLFKNPADEVHITNVSAEAFRDFLHLMYIHTSILSHRQLSIMQQIPDQNVDAILLLAKKYKLVEMLGWYEYYLYQNLNDQNVMWRFYLAQKHSMDNLRKKCVGLLEDDGEKAVTSEAFLNIGQQVLKAILELRFWVNGTPIVDACIKWAKQNCEKNQIDPENSTNLRIVMGDAFELVPFSAMGLMGFVDFQRDYGDMFTDNEIRKMYDTFAQDRQR